MNEPKGGANESLLSWARPVPQPGKRPFVEGCASADWDTDKDRRWRRIKTDRAAHEHMWKRWPLSEVARRMGYTTRAVIVKPRLTVFSGGREFPPDTAGFERTLYGFVPKSLLDQLDACSAASGSSPDAWIDARAKAIGQQSLSELGLKPRSGEHSRTVEVALSDEAYEVLQKAAVEADSSISRIVQHMVADHCVVTPQP